MQKIQNVIGRAANITIGGVVIPAKVDTGADSSSIWASDIVEKGDQLHFVLFSPSSKYYTGEVISLQKDKYSQVHVSSSSGHRQFRYVVLLPAIVEGEEYTVRFTLANRETMSFPALLGRHFLSGRFLVDTSKDISPEIHVALQKDKQQRLQILQGA